MRNYVNYSKTSRAPRRAFEKERLDRELKLVGEYGLRNKREVWRVGLVLSKIRRAARQLLTLPEDDQRRMLEGTALIRRMTRLGLLDETKQKLDYVLSLSTEDFLKRRLQSVVLKKGIAKSIHHARVLIRQGHIRVGKQIVTVPSFMVRVSSEKHIGLAPTSSLAPTGKPGRVKRLKNKSGSSGAADDEDDE